MTTAMTDVEARRTVLAGIIARLEQQRELACVQYLLARAWMDETWRVLREAKNPGERRLALEAHLSAQEAVSETDGVSSRLDVRLERYRLDLDDLEWQ